MGDEDGRRLRRPPGLRDGAPGPFAESGVEGGERLVEEDDRRFGRERTGQRHPLLLAAGELVRVAVGVPRVQAHHLEQLIHPPPGTTRAPGQSEGDVVGHGQVWKEGAFLGHVPHAAQLRRCGLARPPDDPVVELDRSTVGRGEARDQPEQRRLATAGRSEHRDETRGRHVQVDAAKDAGRAERLGDAADGECGHRAEPLVSLVSRMVAGADTSTISAA
ncbi:hypothetical protein GCM10023317_40820 [Actinopolymorpha pittospori]